MASNEDSIPKEKTGKKAQPLRITLAKSLLTPQDVREGKRRGLTLQRHKLRPRFDDDCRRRMGNGTPPTPNVAGDVLDLHQHPVPDSTVGEKDEAAWQEQTLTSLCAGTEDTDVLPFARYLVYLTAEKDLLPGRNAATVVGACAIAAHLAETVIGLHPAELKVGARIPSYAAFVAYHALMEELERRETGLWEMIHAGAELCHEQGEKWWSGPRETRRKVSPYSGWALRERVVAQGGSPLRAVTSADEFPDPLPKMSPETYLALASQCYYAVVNAPCWRAESCKPDDFTFFRHDKPLYYETEPHEDDEDKMERKARRIRKTALRVSGFQDCRHTAKNAVVSMRLLFDCTVIVC